MATYLQDIIFQYSWIANMFGVALIVATKMLMNTKLAWAGVGVILLIIAVMNALLLGTTGLVSANTGATLFGFVVLGSLGARFLGNWLTDGAA